MRYWSSRAEALARAPAQHVALQPVQHAVEEHHADHEDENSADGGRRVELVRTELDHVAEPARGGHELADDGADQRERHADLERGDDPRRGGGQAHLEEDLALARTHDPRDLLVGRLHRTQPGERPVERQKERQRAGQHDLRQLADPEPDDEERGQSHPRDAVGGHDERIEHPGDELEPRQRHAHGDACHTSEHEPEKRLAQRDEQVAEERPLPHPLDQVTRDAQRAREPERIDDASGRGLPQHQDGEPEAQPPREQPEPHAGALLTSASRSSHSVS